MLPDLKRHGGLLALLPVAAVLTAAALWLGLAPAATADSKAPVQVEAQVVGKTTLHVPYMTETNGHRVAHMQESYLLTLALPAGPGKAPHRIEQPVNIAAFHSLDTNEIVSLKLDPTTLRILEITPGRPPAARLSGRMLVWGALLVVLAAGFGHWLGRTRRQTHV